MKQFTLTILTLILGFTHSWAIDYKREFTRHGYIDIQTLDSTIVVDIKYSTTDNFMGINMYGNLHI